MGIEDRDYVRNTGSGYGGGSYTRMMGGGGMPPVCKWILIANIAVFVAQLLITRKMTKEEVVQQYRDQIEYHMPELSPEERQELLEDAARRATRHRERASVVEEWFALKPKAATSGFQFWRFITSAFCHSRQSPWHILLNMLALYWFAPSLERMYGSREFGWFYFVSAFAASAVFVALAFITGDYTPAIGASGAVMAVLMLFAIHYPRHLIYIMGIIPIETRWIALLYVIFSAFPVLSAIGGNPQPGSVAHAAHLGGLAFGFIYFHYQLRLSRTFDGIALPRWERKPRAKHLKLYTPPSNRLDDQVDAILDKINREGEASLTDEEREILKEASRKYGNRQ